MSKNEVLLLKKLVPGSPSAALQQTYLVGCQTAAGNGPLHSCRGPGPAMSPQPGLRTIAIMSSGLLLMTISHVRPPPRCRCSPREPTWPPSRRMRSHCCTETTAEPGTTSTPGRVLVIVDVRLVRVLAVRVLVGSVSVLKRRGIVLMRVGGSRFV